MRGTLLLVIGVLAMLAVAAAWISFETARDPLLREEIGTGSPALIERALFRNVATDQDTFVGDAPITVVIYLAPDDPSTGRFIDTTLPLIHAYAANGTVRYDLRTPVREADRVRQTRAYWLARALACIRTERQALYNLPTEALKSAVDSGTCEYAVTPSVSETRKLGIAMSPTIIVGIEGRDTTTLAGIPSAERLERTLRTYMTRIGG